MKNEYTNLEQLPQVETSPDKKVEVKQETNVEKVDEQVLKKPVVTQQTQSSKMQTNVSAMPIVDPRVKEIENILADGLGDYYTKLNPADQQKFKQFGEEAAKEVDTLLQKAVVKIVEVIGVIKKWLSSVPGLNKFFIEQSAKIKADKVMISNRKDQ